MIDQLFDHLTAISSSRGLVRLSRSFFSLVGGLLTKGVRSLCRQVYFVAAPGTPLERYLYTASLDPAAGGPPPQSLQPWPWLLLDIGWPN